MSHNRWPSTWSASNGNNQNIRQPTARPFAREPEPRVNGGTGAHAPGPVASGGYARARYNLTPMGPGPHRFNTARINRSGPYGPPPLLRGTLQNGLQNLGQNGPARAYAPYGINNSGGSSRPSGLRGLPDPTSNVRPVRLEQARAPVPSSQLFPGNFPTTFSHNPLGATAINMAHCMCNWITANFQLYSSFMPYIQQYLATEAPPAQPIQKQPIQKQPIKQQPIQKQSIQKQPIKQQRIQQQPKQHLSRPVPEAVIIDPELYDPEIDDSENEEILEEVVVVKKKQKFSRKNPRIEREEDYPAMDVQINLID